MRNKQINKILNNLLDIAKNEKCNIYKARINAHIRAFIMKNDINYTIILNSAKKSIWRALIHELLHIYKNDFVIGANVSQIEQKTHKFAQYLTKNAKNDIKKELFRIIAQCDNLEPDAQFNVI